MFRWFCTGLWWVGGGLWRCLPPHGDKAALNDYVKVGGKIALVPQQVNCAPTTLLCPSRPPGGAGAPTKLRAPTGGTPACRAPPARVAAAAAAAAVPRS